MFTTLSYNSYFSFWRAPLPARIAILSRDMVRSPSLVSKNVTPLSYNCCFLSWRAPLPARIAILRHDTFSAAKVVSKNATPYEDRALQVRHSQLELLFSCMVMFGVQICLLSAFKNTSCPRYLQGFLRSPVLEDLLC